MEKYEHALRNATAWFEELREAYRYATTISDERDAERLDELRERPLSVLVREPWHEPGKPAEPAEYEILLTTGDPALRVWGELSEHGEPVCADLEMQDWGVPWRKAWPWESADEAEAKAALMWFASLFWYGEG
jgi:hypothetical protein